MFRSDNAREYCCNNLPNFFDDHGIIHQFSCVCTPRQNGVVERKLRHLLDVTHAISVHMHVPKSYWTDAVLPACYLMNRTPSTVLGGQIPHRVLFSDRPQYTLPPHVCGCMCYVHALDPAHDKFNPRAIKYVFLGYSRTQKGYKCYSPSLRRHFVCADVTFNESLP